MSIAEVFEKYKHLDDMLTNSALVGSFREKILFDCWQAIRAAQQNMQPTALTPRETGGSDESRGG